MLNVLPWASNSKALPFRVRENLASSRTKSGKNNLTIWMWSEQLLFKLSYLEIAHFTHKNNSRN